jgi:hypothetical protein
MRRKRVVNTATLPAPTKGWDAKNSIADMNAESAVILENWFPTTSDVLLRKGYVQHATGFSGQVETLMEYEAANSGSDKLFAAEGTNFYDITSSGAIGAAVVTGLSNARWQYDNFTDSAGQHWLITCNGVDNMHYWDGSTWTTVTGVSSPAITGIATTEITNVAVHKNFLWLVEKNSHSMWYLPVGAVGGAATEFILSGVFTKGGYIVDADNWTLDAGEGMDDYFAVATSEGEVAIYRGTNPASASTWALVGVWALAEPIGNRVFMKFGGDLLAILEDGLQPMSRALLSSQVNRSTALTDQIKGAMSSAATAYNSNFGWELLHYPRSDMLILNVPVIEGSGQEQYVMNTITGAWCKFTGIYANCWAIFNREPFFGSNTYVGQFWFDYSDNGSDIVADAQQAFNYFGSRGETKRWTLARPIIQSIGNPSLSLGLNVNYETGDNTSLLSTAPSGFAEWDSAAWDVDLWGGSLDVSLNWECVSGIGFCAAPRLKAASSGVESRWIATDFTFERGITPL